MEVCEQEHIKCNYANCKNFAHKFYTCLAQNKPRIVEMQESSETLCMMENAPAKPQMK